METRSSKMIFARFCVLQGAYWSFYASLLGFIGAYMLSLGITAAQLGVILALNLLSTLFGSLFWGRWVDRHQASRTYYLIGNASAAALGMCMYFFAGRLVAIGALYALFGFMAGPVPTTLDAWVIASFPERRNAAPKSRSFATLSYAFVMLIMGQLIARIGYFLIPYAIVLFLSISIVTALLQPEVSGLSRSGRAERVDPRSLVQSRRFVLLVFVIFFTGMAVMPINSMKAVIIENVGGDVGILGWDAFIGCILQAQFLIFSNKLQAIRTEHRLILGNIAPLFYALAVALGRRPEVIILGTIMNNVSFGLLFPTMREMTEESVSPALRNTAHSVIDIAYGSLSGMIASAWSGVVMERGGSIAMGSVCFALQMIALGFAVSMLFIKGTKRKAAVRG